MANFLLRFAQISNYGIRELRIIGAWQHSDSADFPWRVFERKARIGSSDIGQQAREAVRNRDVVMK
jgi:hypothetical protein